MITDYHAKYFAYELTKQCPSDSIQKLMISLADAPGEKKPNAGKSCFFWVSNF